MIKNFLVKFLTGLFTLLISLFLAEVLLRVFWNPPSLDERYVRNDFKWLKGNVVLNSNNWRDKEYDVDNKTGNYRVIVLGDSYTFGWYINDVERTFPRQLEKNLEEKFAGSNFDVINTSRHGFDVAEQLARLKNEAIWFHPNLVIQGVNMWDFNCSVPLFNLPTLLNKLYLYPATVGKFIALRERNSTLANCDRVFSGNSKEFKTAGQKLLEAKKLAEENGAKYAILVFPEIDHSSPNSGYLHRNYHEAIKRFAQENSILVIDPLTSFLNVPDKSKLIINPNDSHPSELAHELIAESIMTQYNFGRDLKVYKPIEPRVQKRVIQKMGDELESFRHVRNIQKKSGSFYPAVYFERKNGVDIQSRPPQNLQDRKLAFLEDKFKTVKSYTHPGWPGAIIEYNLEPDRNQIVLSNLYGFPILGIKQFTAYWRDEEKHSEVAEWLLPERVSLNNNNMVIDVNPQKDYYLYRIEVLVGVEQVDIEENGEVADITATQELEATLIEDSSKVAFNTKGKIGSYPIFLLNEGFFPWAFVDGVMVLAKSADVEDGRFILKFNKEIKKRSKVLVPVSARSDQITSFLVEYE